MAITILVANRGEIACRIMRTIRVMGHRSVALYAPQEQMAPHRWLADGAVGLQQPLDYLDAHKNMIH